MKKLSTIVFDLDTEFVNKKDKKLSEIYDEGSGWYEDLSAKWTENVLKGEDYCSSKGKSVGDLKFGNFSPKMIDEIINIQINKVYSVEEDDLLDQPRDLTFGELALLNDLKAWIMERRANDIETSLVRNKSNINIAEIVLLKGLPVISNAFEFFNLIQSFLNKEKKIENYQFQELEIEKDKVLLATLKENDNQKQPKKEKQKRESKYRLDDEKGNQQQQGADPKQPIDKNKGGNNDQEQNNDLITFSDDEN